MSARSIEHEMSKPLMKTREKPISRPWLSYASTLLLVAAAGLLLLSMPYPYWGLVLHAPQYPGGLEMRVFVNRMTGDADTTLDEVREIDGLNHYIGMQSLYNAARIERKLAVPAVLLSAGLALLAAFWRRRWTWLLAIPGLVFPFLFLGDLAFWLNHYGQNLDPNAPLSSAIKPFTPPILGEGVIGQFRTVAAVDRGWLLAVAGSLLSALALFLRAIAQRRSAS